MSTASRVHHPDLHEVNSSSLEHGVRHRYLIREKLRIPQPQSTGHEIERRHLLELLERSSMKRVTLIKAPAGYGKTSLASEWCRTSDRTISWLTLDVRDNERFRFLRYLEAAIEELSGAVSDSQREEIRTLPPDLVVDALATLAGSIDGPATLVLDDLNTITDDWVLEALEYFILFSPDNLHFVLLSRSQPVVSWSRLKIKNDFAAIDVGDFAASSAEIMEVFETSGVSLSESQAAAILDATGGWISAVRLLAMSPSDGRVLVDSQSIFEHEMVGELLSDYLVEEVVERQAPERVDFLVRIALCDRVCGPLCEHLTGASNGHRALMETMSAGLFLTPLGPDSTWFSLHPIFRKVLLRHASTVLQPIELREAHVRASHWFEENEHLEEAITHAVMSQGWSRATGLLLTVATRMVDQGQSEQVISWLDQVPQEFIDRSPPLALCQAAAAANSSKSQLLANLVARYQFIWDQDPDPDIRARGAIAAARLELDRSDWRGSIDFSRRALEENGGRNTDLEVTARYEICRALWMSGKPRRTLQFVDELSGELEGVESAVAQDVTLALRLARGRLKAELGDVLQGQMILESLTKQYAHQSLRVRVVATNWLAWAAFVQNDLNQCYERLRTISHLEFAGQLARFEPRWHLLRSRLLAAKRDIDGALDAIDEAIAVSKYRNDLRWLRTAKAARARFALTVDEGAVVEEWINQTTRPSVFSSDVTDVDDSLTFARVFISLKQYLGALDILTPVTTQARLDGRMWDELEGLLLSAIALIRIGDRQESRRHLREALSLARPGSVIRPFLEAGPEVLEELAELRTDEINGTHVVRILAGQTSVAGRNISFVRPVESLTPRELQILRMVSIGLTNQAIAERAGVAIATVKRHMSNILVKLEAQNRTEALHRARQLQILAE